MTRSVPASVVISTLDEGESLSETVSSVLGAHTVPREVVIVDDGSTDGSCTRAWPKEVRVVRQEHHGIATARNLGANQATQPVLVFLDAHCTVDAGWLEPLVHALENAPDALVGPSVRDSRDPRFVGCGACLVDELFTYRWLPAATSSLREVGLVPGGCMAVRRELFLESGGLAAFREFGVEDVELAIRWWRHGRPMLGAGESSITHLFRARAPYRADYEAWTENVLRTALLHLPADLMKRTVTACSQFATFGTAIGTVLAEPWIPQHQLLAASEVRPVARYLERWAPALCRGVTGPA